MARRAATPTPIYVSVNVSPRQFRQPGTVVEQVRAATEGNGVDPSLLVLEITESVLMQDRDAVRDELTALQQMGVRVAIDDFGTGYSALTYLRDFPIDMVKMDQSFVDDLSAGRGDQALVRSVVELGEALDMEIVAEGIERRDQLDHLSEMRCNIGQGYFFARPLDARRHGRADRRPDDVRATRPARTLSAQAITRVTESATQTGFSPPSISTVQRWTTWCQPPPTSSTETISIEARMFESTGHRRREADLVPAVVHAQLEALLHQQAVAEAVDRGQRQVAVGDRAAERALGLRALDVHVDPLVVAGDLGEAVDHLLVDRAPVAGADRLPDQVLEFLDAVDGGGCHAASVPADCSLSCTLCRIRSLLASVGGGMGRFAFVFLGVALVAALLAAPAAQARSADAAALQVALKGVRAYGGPVDGIAGPATRRGGAPLPAPPPAGGRRRGRPPHPPRARPPRAAAPGQPHAPRSAAAAGTWPRCSTSCAAVAPARAAWTAASAAPPPRRCAATSAAPAWASTASRARPPSAPYGGAFAGARCGGSAAAWASWAARCCSSVPCAGRWATASACAGGGSTRASTSRWPGARAWAPPAAAWSGSRAGTRAATATS